MPRPRPGSVLFKTVPGASRIFGHIDLVETLKVETLNSLSKLNDEDLRLPG